MARVQERAGDQVGRALGRDLREKARAHVQQMPNQDLFAPGIAMPFGHEVGHRLIERRNVAQHECAADGERRDLLRQGEGVDRRSARVTAKVGFPLDPAVAPDDECVGVVDFRIAFRVVQRLLRNGSLPGRRGRERRPVGSAGHRFLIDVDLFRSRAHLRLLVALHVQRLLFRRKHQPAGKEFQSGLCLRGESGRTEHEGQRAQPSQHGSGTPAPAALR